MAKSNGNGQLRIVRNGGAFGNRFIDMYILKK
jgi:hypothetical protein